MPIQYSELKPGMIVHIYDEWEDEDGEYSDNAIVVVLNVTDKDLRQGCNTDHTGLHGFRGLWYKGNGTTRKSYGKIYDIECYSTIEIIAPNLYGMSKSEINHIVDGNVNEVLQKLDNKYL